MFLHISVYVDVVTFFFNTFLGMKSLMTYTNLHFIYYQITLQLSCASFHFSQQCKRVLIDLHLITT